MSIEVKNISKSFGAFQVLDNLSLEVASGELVALLGPSGCGKTSLLRIIAGLESPDHGSVLLGGRDATHTSVRERRVGFVFQHYALFRQMTVFDNVAFGLTALPRSQRPGKAEIREKVLGLLKMVQLEALAQRYPSQLSGGQRQRVALARALAVDPQVLLLDEPFGALDAKVRKELRRWLRRLHEELHVTSVFVTHDQEEALEVADRVVVMNHGHIEQIGTPQQVWEEPASPFVYGFLGDVNRFHGQLRNGRLDIGGFELQVEGLPSSGEATAYVRPHEFEIMPFPQPGTGSQTGQRGGIVARLERASIVGPFAQLELVVRDDAKLTNNLPAAGAVIDARMAAQHFSELGVSNGDTLLVIPGRARVFVEKPPA